MKNTDRDLFMDIYRDEEFHSHMSSDDCEEVFFGILKGSSDITAELLARLCAYYDVSWNEIRSKAVDE